MKLVHSRLASVSPLCYGSYMTTRVIGYYETPDHRVGQKFLYPTGETITDDWYGYGPSTTSTEPILATYQGDRFRKLPPLDFYAPVYYIPMDDDSLPKLSSRKPRMTGRHARY